MANMKFKLSAAAVSFLKETAEIHITIPADSYTALLEQGILCRLLKRKACMFMYPKEINTVTLHVDEAAVVHRLASIVYGISGDAHARNMTALFMMAIGPKLPVESCNKLIKR